MSGNGNGNGAIKALADSAYLRAAGHLVSIVGMPIVGYMLFTMLTLRTDVTSLQGDIRRIDDAMILRTQLRYTSEDAKRDFSGVGYRLDEMSHRLDKLESK